MGEAVAKKLDGPTEAQLAKGGYPRKFVTHVDTNTIVKTHVSRHDPIERWIALERLDDHQVSAIRHCQRLWQLAGLPIQITARYGERIPVTGSTEHLNNAQIDARKDLYRVMDYFAGLEKWWSVFEHVCRFGESAEQAGLRLGFGLRSAPDRAHTVVCFVADKIAEQERL